MTPARLALVFLVLASCLHAAEVAVQTDGRRVTGTLSLDARGQLQFTVPGKAQPLPPESIAQVRFAGEPGPFRVGSGHRVLLHDGQVLTGQLLTLEKDLLTLRTAWADRLSLPRNAVVAVTQLPGWQTLFEDDFAEGLKGWSSTGKPVVNMEKPTPVALLNELGQSLVYALPAPLTAGRIGVNFQERENPAGARWLLEIQFQDERKPRRLRVTLASGAAGYPVEAVGLTGIPGESNRSTGWHRLTVQWTPRSVRVLCDDAVLWYNLEQGPGGPLQQVRLLCVEDGKSSKARASVAFTAFAVAQSVDEEVRPPGDPNQDEVWLAGGDQLFGTLLSSDGRTLEMQGRFGKRRLPWTAVRGCYFRQGPIAAPNQPISPVRLWLRSGLSNDPDIVDGVLLNLDERTLRFRHPLLGELSVPRDRVKLLQPGAARK